MLCPICKTEMRIKGARYVAENDNTAEAKTKLYIVQDLVCVNEKCANYEKVVDEVKSEMALSDA